jgi:hypothetical protein
MRMGHLQRDVDPSHVSGCGVIAEIVMFTDGQVVLHWVSEIPSTAIYPSLEQMLAIHSHGACTHVEWDDGQEPHVTYAQYVQVSGNGNGAHS